MFVCDISMKMYILLSESRFIPIFSWDVCVWHSYECVYNSVRNLFHSYLFIGISHTNLPLKDRDEANFGYENVYIIGRNLLHSYLFMGYLCVIFLWKCIYYCPKFVSFLSFHGIFVCDISMKMYILLSERCFIPIFSWDVCVWYFYEYVYVSVRTLFHSYLFMGCLCVTFLWICVCVC
jgi:hypothetical protein